MPSSIPYTLKRYKKSKSLRVKIKTSGDVLVTAPYRVSKKYIDSFIQSKVGWIQEKIDLFKSLPQPHIQTKRGDYKKYKEQARTLVEQKLEKVNSFYNFKFNRVFIRDQKTRWGSCSSKKNLNFNYKIIFLPDHLAEYIIAHELCHLKEMNHGKGFWDLVGQTIMNPLEVQRELREFRINRLG